MSYICLAFLATAKTIKSIVVLLISHEPYSDKHQKDSKTPCKITFKNVKNTTYQNMATLDENPIKQSLLKAIRKGNCQKVREILTTSGMSPNETVDSAQNRLPHKAAR